MEQPSAGIHFSHQFYSSNSDKKVDQVYEYKTKEAVLGEGSYGQVMKAKHKMTQAIRALKIIDKKKVSNPDRFKAEVEIQRSLDHPHIVKLYETFEDNKMYYLVMELCSGGELFDKIVEEAEKNASAGQEGHSFTEAAASSCMSQILGAMAYIHSKHYCHRDIKPENFLLLNKEADAPVKVIDFGLAAHFDPGKAELRTKAGTPYYVAPDVLQCTQTKGYDEKCDIWSCGVLAYIILCGYPPFYGDNDGQILQMVRKGKYDFPADDWDSVSRNAKDLITQMLRLNPAERPNAKDLLEHPWIKETSHSGKALSFNLGRKLKDFSSGGKLKKIVLTLIARQCKEEEIVELKEAFESLDANRDGTLTVTEIFQAMEKQNPSMAEDMKAAMRRDLNNLDTDGSGVIDYSEWIAATLQFEAYSKRETLWGAFRVFDVDGSGSIDAAELASVMSDEDVQKYQACINEVDINKDGKIDFEEFCLAMSSTNGQGIDLGKAIAASPKAKPGAKAHPKPKPGAKSSPRKGPGGHQ